MNQTIENLMLEKLALEKQLSELDKQIKIFQEEKSLDKNMEQFRTDLAYYLDVCERWDLRPNFKTGYTYGDSNEEIGILKNKLGYICIGRICGNSIQIGTEGTKFRLSDKLPDLDVNPILKQVIMQWDSISATIEDSLTDRIYKALKNTRQQVQEKKEICDLLANDKAEDALKRLNKADSVEKQPVQDENLEEGKENFSQNLYDNFLDILKKASEKAEKNNRTESNKYETSGSSDDSEASEPDEYSFEELLSQVLEQLF